MKYILTASAVAAALALGGCNSANLPTPDQIKQVEVSIQNSAMAFCKVAPTIETIGLMAAGLVAGGAAVDQVANEVVNQFCSVVTTNANKVGAKLKDMKVGEPAPVGDWHGYEIQGVKK